MRSIVGPWRRLRYGPPIIVVSGLPRSGTSMMMKMLGAGGVPLLIDAVRAADDSNPGGYFEFEPVKALEEQRDLSWLPSARGKAVKIVSLLLTWLPETYNYRVVFMERDLGEVVRSQQAMLRSGGHAEADDPEAADQARTRQLYANHLEQTDGFLSRRSCFKCLPVNYQRVIEQPAEEAARVASFLGRTLDVERMVAVVDRRLYRNRR
jgi:hypothetical protein